MRIPGVPFVQGRNSYADRDGRKFGIAIHNTSNDASDEGEASYATWRPDGTSSHLYGDRDSVTQSLSLTARAGHAGSKQGNENAYAVEITGANGKSRLWWLTNVAWGKLGAALAWIIRNDPDLKGFQVRRATVAEMKANPQVKAFYGHDDMRRAWGGTTHTDPGPNFPWDRLFAAVNAALNEEDHMLWDHKVVLQRDASGKATQEWQADTALGYAARKSYEGARDAAAGRTELAQVRADLAAAQLRDEAILDAVRGTESAEILARIDARAAELVNGLAAMPRPASAEEIAQEVVNLLGGQGVDEAAQALIAALGMDRAAAIATAVTELASDTGERRADGG